MVKNSILLYSSELNPFTDMQKVDEIQKKDNTDTIVSAYYDVSHVVVGCGYRQDIYYNASGQVIATREYIKVASGQSDHGICYLNISSIGDIDRVIAAKIS